MSAKQGGCLPVLAKKGKLPGAYCIPFWHIPINTGNPAWQGTEYLYDETISLSKTEKDSIKEIVEIFRRNTYRKLENGTYYMMTYDILT
ncbi:MAG: hypothetical protein U1D97_05330, partial [Desulfuromonadales bacterium]|nr:hypothetical protein [Desulfuromonadales bacterium]